ncbi:MAG: biphenyl 2,3-dioxygenase [Elusimicrobia bacterium CG1_02_63_36]|nr:MAG: biphenyl 2,3-dioxygenase [Elusimicrobia bacterium CG1_02_63_36]PIP82785.1 MAG: biphenyl 2,3-dioxygenase [Elusimicrobia bacterium CG22_combo_CG10-13_8_21_14_all_63_91]PJA16092.1 MAG: biphenyl 2,3-dioxygenase [Elusimicrobia bacterium CG_4_10_14_0_2_um_filter_63_34]PJB24679.1 MAG: biphenyl 2,3-dioxygenase [Elusimicrobia bacterium CG_4_9_14_3_um_filter_62_55]
MGVKTAVCKRGDVPAGGMKIVSYEGKRVAVCDVAGTLYAIEDLCTHDDGPLGDGSLDGDQVECPRHGARFDVKNGAALRMPAIVPVRTYTATVEGDEVFLKGPR